MFKPSMSAEIQDWITPRQVEVVKVETLAEQFERIQQRAKELREAMRPRYLCHERIGCGAWMDGRTGHVRTSGPSNGRRESLVVQVRRTAA